MSDAVKKLRKKQKLEYKLKEEVVTVLRNIKGIKHQW
jgi:hypothetical protein